jgi:hypothetical protein
MKYFSPDIQYFSQDSNRVSPEYKSRTSPVDQPARWLQETQINNYTICGLFVCIMSISIDSMCEKSIANNFIL